VDEAREDAVRGGGECQDAALRGEGAIAEVRARLDDAVRRLDAAGARDEALAEFVPRHRRLLVTREATLRPIGRVWRLGVLLLDRASVLRATGSIIRATAPGRPAYQSLSAESRRAYRAAAQRGHFAPGETVDFDAPVIDLQVDALTRSTGPLLLREGRALVRWSAASTAAVPFESYLSERVELLLHPPEGA
jgi:hypothetical protein